ncbi:nucleotide sugar dehydrogenase [uncultured Neptuniibacter sp.]|uniref:nucleotide sugar dehydrogenase n=1 Tax=uncultured Neptuniibacter sp. TaxID=502143 RepID=UPI002627976D|nr:nucleotide sugar dehydrogenase [uncultured Neptuniibacter sp.]
MKVTIWGNELLAWTSAAALAESGNHVVLVNNEHELPDEVETEFKVSNEPGLEQLLTETKATGRLAMGTDQLGINHASVHILALNPDQFGTAELLIARLSAKHSNNLLIINQSNFGVGSTDRLQNRLDACNNQVISYIPNMLAEGTALQDYKTPLTYIIGCTNDWAMLNIKALFRPFSQVTTQWLLMTSKEAEFTKFANTGMLALRLGYINELANLADQLDVDIEVIRAAMITDPRIGPHYLHPGCGFGGLHFQQYIEALSELLSETRNSKLLDTVLTENEKQKEQPFRKLWRHYDCDLEKRTISIWGLSFKAGTASIDNAPSLKIIDALLAQNCKIQVHDPEAMSNIQKYFGDHSTLTYCDNSYDALKGSDALLLLTDWPEYWSPDLDKMKELMINPLIIDGRNLLDKELLVNSGFKYYGVGR